MRPVSEPRPKVACHLALTPDEGPAGLMLSPLSLATQEGGQWAIGRPGEGGHQDDVTAERILPPKYFMLDIRLGLVEVLAVFITCVSSFLINRQVQIRSLLGVLY